MDIISDDKSKKIKEKTDNIENVEEIYKCIKWLTGC